MISKTYTIPVHREIASSEVIKTSVENSSFNLEIDKIENTQLNQDFETKIFNIDKKGNQLIIYSNTLNIKVTDKFYNNIPLYFKKVFDSEREYQEFIRERTEILVDFTDDLYIVYFNKTKEELILDVSELNVINNPLKRSSNVKVRKLKNRLKTTINNIDTTNVSIILPSRFIFEPIIHKNFIEFYESFFEINDKYYIYNSSFNLLEKNEYTKDSNLVKDPVIEYLGYSDSIQHYTTWRSNLLMDEKLNTEFYYYLKLNSTNKTDLIEQSIVKKNELDYLLLFSTNYTNNIKNITINPYLESVVSTPIGENYSILYKEVESNKYNRYNDVKFGTEAVILDLEKNIKNRSKYLKRDFTIIHQEDVLNSDKNYVEKDYSTLDTFFIENILSLKEKISNITEQEQGIDKKLYKESTL